jgi:hypothetical protein
MSPLKITLGSRRPRRNPATAQIAVGTAPRATGTGTSDIDSCVPNCAQAPPNYVTTTITLSAPVSGRFTHLVESVGEEAGAPDVRA